MKYNNEVFKIVLLLPMGQYYTYFQLFNDPSVLLILMWNCSLIIIIVTDVLILSNSIYIYFI